MNKIQLTLPQQSTYTSSKSTELSIALSGSNVCTSYALGQFLQVVETKIFNDFKWYRVNGNLESILREYEHAYRFGLEYKIQYIINDLKGLYVVEKYKASISREAEIRLLGASIELKTTDL